MTDQYSQEIDVVVDPSDKKKQYIGIFATLFSLGFVVLAFFISYYFFIGFGIMFIFGIFYIQLYNFVIKQFTYDYNSQRLVIVKKDVVNRQKRMLCVLLDDVKSFEIMDGLFTEEDVIACSKSSENVYQLIYSENETTKRLLFSPDDYLVALLHERLHG